MRDFDGESIGGVFDSIPKNEQIHKCRLLRKLETNGVEYNKKDKGIVATSLHLTLMEVDSIIIDTNKQFYAVEQD